jgi:ribose transport system substrate-binding protein
MSSSAKELTIALTLMIVAVGFSQASAAKPLKIGFSMVTQQSPFYVELKKGAQAAASDGGAKLMFEDANGDLSRQNNDIEDLLTRKIDVLLIDPVDPQGVAPSMNAAQNNNVPVVSVDRNVRGKTASYVGRHNVKMAKLSGKALVAALKKKGVASGKIAVIRGAPGGTVDHERYKGFRQAIKGKDYNVIDGPHCKYIRKCAISAMQDIIQAHPHIKAVFALNDDMGMGVLKVLRESGHKDVLVAVVDGLSEAIGAIQNGHQYVATAVNDPRYLGKLAVKVAIRAAKGKTVHSFTNAGTKAVTRKNAGEIKHDGPFAQYAPTSRK